MKLLSKENYRQLFIGSAFFSCGGGVPYEKSISIMHEPDRPTVLKPLSEFNPEDWLCTVYAIGASGQGIKKYDAFLLALRELEAYLGICVSGIIPGEIGPEINAVWTANATNTALVDTDMVGGRAVPEEQMDIYGINNIKSTPAIVVNDRSDVLVVKNSHDMKILEKIYRSFAIASGGYCYIASRPIKQVDACKLLPSGTVSTALNAGNIFNIADSVDELVSSLDRKLRSKLLLKGEIVSFEEKNESGFFSGVISLIEIEEDAHEKYTLHFKNENIILFKDRKYVCSVPDLISIVDLNTLLPIPCSSLTSGLRVMVFGTPALQLWKTDAAIAMLGPDRFGFQHAYNPI